MFRYLLVSAAIVHLTCAVGECDSFGKASYPSLVFSPDGKFVAAGDDGKVRLWETSTGRLLYLLRTRGDVLNSVMFSPDGKWLVTGTELLHDVTLWDAQSGVELRRFAGVGPIAFSPDGKALASLSPDSAIQLWDPATGKPLARLPWNGKAVYAMTFSPDGSRLAVLVGELGREVVQIRSVPSGGLVSEFAASGSIRFSLDGATLVCGGGVWEANGYTGALHFWGVQTGKLMRTIKGHSEYVGSIDISRDGSTLLSGSTDKTVKLWDMDTDRLLQTFAGDDPVQAVALSPDGQMVASFSSLKAVALWSTRTGELLRRLGYGM